VEAEPAPLASGERNGRRYTVDVRPGMAEGQYLGIMLRQWGEYQGSVANGEPHFYGKRADAVGAGERWLDAGRR
jgi:cell wall assembly regulator SMI1